MQQRISDPIVFLPGLQSDHRSWVHQLTHFGGQYPTIVPSGHHDAGSMAQMAAVVLQQLPARFHMVAWSMGGYLTFEMLPSIANRLVTLTLIATSASADSEERVGDRRRQITIGETKGMRVANRISLSNSCVDQSLLETAPLQAMTQAAVEIGPEAYRKQQTALMERKSTLDRLSLIRCPTSIIVGAEDTTTPPSEAQRIHAAIGGSQLHVIPACSHCVPMENPGRVNELINACLEKATV